MIQKIKTRWSSIPLTFKVSSAYAICNILQKSIAFLTLPLFTRFLTTEQYGQYTIYASWLSLICIFVTLNLFAGSFSTAMIKFENNRNEYISSIEGIFILLSLLFLAVYLPFREKWNSFLELPTFIILIMIFDIIGQSSIQLWSGKKRFEFKYISVVLLTLAVSFFCPLLALLLVRNTLEKGYARIVGYAVVNIIMGLTIFIINLARGRKLFNKEYWKFALSFNIPLLAYYFSQMIFNQSDRIMISHITGKSDAGIYGVAYSLSMLLTFVLNAINNSYVPWLYEKIKKRQYEYNKLVASGIAAFMALLIICVIWYAPEIILIMAGKEYISAIYIVPPVSMSLLLLFYSQLFINVEFYYEEKKMLVWASIGAALLNVVLNWIFIPRLGFVAAGYTTLASYLVFALSNHYTMKLSLKNRNISEDLYNNKQLMLIYVTLSLFGFLGVCLYPFLIIRIIVTFFVLIILILNRSKIIKILKFKENFI